MKSGPTLRAGAPWRVFEGFGRAQREVSRGAEPRTVEELEALLAQAQIEGLPVAFRGAGLSYGDAAINGGGLVLDMSGMDRFLSWDPQAGIAEVEPGLTIRGLWTVSLRDGWLPPVMPGTMFPTLGGCIAMNIHGKNNFKVGSIGDHVLDLDLVSPGGGRMRCSREENSDVFRAVVGGAGLLGAVTRIRLQLKKVHSGNLRVEAISAPTLDSLFDTFEARLPRSDYLVGWLDCFASGAALGRGVIHQANYLEKMEAAREKGHDHMEEQTLPDMILGIPRNHLWRLMLPFLNDAGMRLINEAKYRQARMDGHKTYLQSHVSFAFLLDYVPDWRLAYGPEGFIQYQVFVPAGHARATMRAMLGLCQRRGLVSYLAVLKKHRPDEFLLSPNLDGYSLALDFRITRSNRVALMRLTHELTALVLDAGGRFYLAKDGVLGPDEFARACGERLPRFLEMKRRLDPRGLLSSTQFRRLFGHGTLGS